MAGHFCPATDDGLFAGSEPGGGESANARNETFSGNEISRFGAICRARVSLELRSSNFLALSRALLYPRFPLSPPPPSSFPPQMRLLEELGEPRLINICAITVLLSVISASCFRKRFLGGIHGRDTHEGFRRKCFRAACGYALRPASQSSRLARLRPLLACRRWELTGERDPERLSGLRRGRP